MARSHRRSAARGLGNRFDIHAVIKYHITSPWGRTQRTLRPTLFRAEPAKYGYRKGNAGCLGFTSLWINVLSHENSNICYSIVVNHAATSTPDKHVTNKMYIYLYIYLYKPEKGGDEVEKE